MSMIIFGVDSIADTLYSDGHPTRHNVVYQTAKMSGWDTTKCRTI